MLDIIIRLLNILNTVIKIPTGIYTRRSFNSQYKILPKSQLQQNEVFTVILVVLLYIVILNILKTVIKIPTASETRCSSVTPQLCRLL